jgi:class 3 adenylate cyclase
MQFKKMFKKKNVKKEKMHMVSYTSELISTQLESPHLQTMFFTYVPILMLYSNSMYAPAFIMPFLLISLMFYMWLFFSSREANSKLASRRELVMAKQVLSIGLHTTMYSMFINNISSLLLFRYTSWILSFPHFLELETRTMNVPPSHPLKISKMLMTWVFLFTIASECLRYSAPIISHICEALLWIISVLFFIQYNAQRTITQSSHSNVNFIVVVYGATYLARQFSYIDDIWYYIMIIFLDVLSKCSVLVVFSTKTRLWNNTLKDVQVLRLIMPKLKQALAANVIDERQFNQYVDLIDCSKYNVAELRQELLDDLFPKSAIKSALSVNFQHTIHESLSVMFVDMVNYTTFVNTTPLEDVVRYMNDFYCNMDMITHRYGVDKVETIGDAYLVVSEDADKCIMCAMEMLRQYKDAIRIGMHIGRVASCTMGLFKIRHSYVGHTVNMAARMESNGVPGNIHVTEEVKEAVKDAWVFAQRDTHIQLKGIGMVQTYFVER